MGLPEVFFRPRVLAPRSMRAGAWKRSAARLTLFARSMVEADTSRAVQIRNANNLANVLVFGAFARRARSVTGLAASSQVDTQRRLGRARLTGDDCEAHFSCRASARGCVSAKRAYAVRNLLICSASATQGCCRNSSKPETCV